MIEMFSLLVQDLQNLFFYDIIILGCDTRNLIFLRYGEEKDNVKELISDKEIYWYILTERVKQSVKESLTLLPNNIN